MFVNCEDCAGGFLLCFVARSTRFRVPVVPARSCLEVMADMQHPLSDDQLTQGFFVLGIDSLEMIRIKNKLLGELGANATSWFHRLPVASNEHCQSRSDF